MLAVLAKLPMLELAVLELSTVTAIAMHKTTHGSTMSVVTATVSMHQVVCSISRGSCCGSTSQHGSNIWAS